MAISKVENLRKLLMLAAPIAVSQLAQTSMGFVDTVMVGRLGATNLAAVSLGSAIFFGILVFALGILVAVGPIVAQLIGAGDEEGAGHSARHGLYLAAMLTPVVVLLLYAVQALVPFIIDDAEVVSLAQGYLGAVSWSVFPFLGFVALRSWIEAVGRPLIVTVFAVVTVGVNVLGNYAFVYGSFGFPQLGAVGTGYATSLSNLFLFVSLSAYALWQKDLRTYRVFAFRSSFDKTRITELLKVGGPIGVSFGIEVGLFSATAVLIGSLGAVSLASHQIAIQCASLTFMLPLSIALASTIRVGNLVGAGDAASARDAGWLGIAVGTGIMVITALAFVLFPNTIVRFFLGEIAPADVPVADLAAQLLVYAGAFQIADGIQGTAAGALRGLKDTLAPMVIGFVSYWIIGLGSGYLLSEHYGVFGFWSGLVVGLMVASLLLVGRWWRMGRVNNITIPQQNK